MFYDKKNVLYSLVLFSSFLGVYLWRKYNTEPPKKTVQPISLMVLGGNAMGSTYNIRYLDSTKRYFKPAVDSLLDVFNLSLSTYLPNSDISKFNQFETDSVLFNYPFFYPVLQRSKEIYAWSNGAFDPTIAPLIKAWGFGNKREVPDKQPNIDSLKQFIGFDKIVFNEKSIRKLKKGVSLNFNAIAQGYGVDVVANYLKQQGITNFMVEIGGEVSAQGKNDKNKFWTIGISDPKRAEAGEEVVFAALQLENRAMATSGNYRNFYIKNDKKFAHTINPKTGFPVQHSLLSASVFAPDCMTADALATAFMVLGKDEGLMMIKNKTNISVFLVYEEFGKLKTYISDDLKYVKSL